MLDRGVEKSSLRTGAQSEWYSDRTPFCIYTISGIQKNLKQKI